MREELKNKLQEAANEFCSFDSGAFEPSNILANLRCSGVIVQSEVEVVKEKTLKKDRIVTLLLDILPSKNDNAFDIFKIILDKERIHSEVLQLPTCPTDPKHLPVCHDVIEEHDGRSKPDTTHVESSGEEEWKNAFHNDYNMESANVMSPGIPCKSHSLYKTICMQTKEHPLFHEINDLVLKQLKYTKKPLEEEGGWRLFSDEDGMKLYRRSAIDYGLSGLTVDPLKAIYTVKGITAYEYCHYFFDPSYRCHWDLTVEKILAIQRIADDTIICHQLHVPVKGGSPRESVFWSHIRRMDSHRDASARDLYIVCNRDTQCSDMKNQPGYVRVGCSVAMMCQTFIDPEARLKSPSELKRDDFFCKVVYVAQVSPGGWIPDFIINTIFETAFPKVLKQFTRYVKHQTSGCPDDFQIRDQGEKGSWSCNIL